MMGPLLVYLLLQGVLLYDTLAWEVRMPKEIRGLKGSCLVIPCSFSYTSNPPKNPRRVVWYQWVSRGYPLVYDPLHADKVIEMFRGKTDLYEKSSRDCSLLITRLEASHDGEKLYAWIDPENVRKSTYTFYDVTSTVHVNESPQEPSISIYGSEKMGDTTTVICSVFHTCPYSKPSITLNGIEGTDEITDESIEDGLWKTTLTRTGAIKTGHSTIKCSVTHYGGITVTETKNISAQFYQKPVQNLNETHIQYEADVIPKITALPHSCVVIPCSFKLKDEYVTGLQVLWVTEGGGYMFHTDPVNVLDNFKDRTRVLGNPDEQNCTVEMDNVQTHDNGPFCFRADKENEKYSFNNSCVFIIMRAPAKPVMSSLPETIEPGTHVTVKCSVNHTCSSHPPEITWSVPTARETISHNHMGGGVWETVSAVTFIPTVYEQKVEIVCTAKFWGGKTQKNTASISIRTVHGLRLETLGSLVIAPSLVFVLICVLAGVFIYKIRHRQLHPDMQGSQSQSEQRRSVWNRFSRHQSPRTQNVNLKAEYRTNNICTVSGNKPFSKPHMPSPKSEPKSSSHHGEKLYTWIDPENVGSSTFVFYDVTSTIQVDASPHQPSISISGGKRTEDSITVECSTFHTCPYSKPAITLNGIEESDQIIDDDIKDGWWKTTLTRSGVVKTEHSTIQCSVTHYGGITVTETKNTSAQCVHHKISIEPELADVTEGVTKSFTCSVYHSCQNENPTITWNYENMQVTKGSKTLSGVNQVTYSNISFLGAKEDNGTKLTCTANFSGGNITASVVLRVQCVQYNISIEPELADVTEGVPMNFTCSVYHSCQNENPNITWNHENMQVTEWNKTLPGLDQITSSSITFLTAKEDHGKKLICTAKFSGRDITASVILNVQSPFHEADPELIGLKTIGLYILTPSLVFLLACILAGVIIYKKQQRSKDAMSRNKPSSKCQIPLPKSDPKSCSGYDYESEYTNMDELNVYGKYNEHQHQNKMGSIQYL